MTTSFRFDPVELPPEAKELRQEVRAFLHQEAEAGTLASHRGKGGFSREFSRKMGARGWIGMTWPKKYGGHERSQLERYVVTEEMLAAHAPTRAHSTADRQSGPVILRYGQEEVRQRILPRIAAGELCFCIGLSEPNSGSDVFAASTRATKTDGGWLVNGRKIWTSNAHERRLHDRAAADLAVDQGKPPPRADPVPDRDEDTRDHDPPHHQPDRQP